MIDRLTISLTKRLVARLDEEVRTGRRPSRSAAVAAALELYYARRLEDQVREATIEYYALLSEDERGEAAAIARASTRALSSALRRQEGQGARRAGQRRRG